MVTFSIKHKLIAFCVAIIALFLILIILTVGLNEIRLNREQNLNNEKSHCAVVDDAIGIFFQNVSNIIDIVGKDRSILMADDSITNYCARTQDTPMEGLERSPVEREIFNFLTEFKAGEKDYLSIYLGTEFGGYVTSSMNTRAGGYDPRMRSWYKAAKDATLAGSGGYNTIITPPLQSRL